MRHVVALFSVSMLFISIILPSAIQAVPGPAADPRPTLVKNINTATRVVNPPFYQINYTKKAGNLVYYLDYDLNNNVEPHVTDGTVAGTRLLRDLEPGANAATAGMRVIDADGTTFFSAGNDLGISYLWKSNGTAAGTTPVLHGTNNALTFAWNNTLFPLKNMAIFSGGVLELWRSDGTPTGTFMLYTWPDLHYDIKSAGTLNDKAYFFVPRTSGTGSTALWQTDGISAGTSLVKVLTNRIADTFEGFVLDNQLFFVFDNVLWRSDGSTAGTQPFLNTSQFYGNVVSHAGQLYFLSVVQVPPTDPQGISEQHTQLRRISATGTTPEMVYDFGAGVTAGQGLSSVGGRLVFLGPRYEIWSSDGSTTAPVTTASGQKIYDPRISLDVTTRFRALTNGSVILAATQAPNEAPVLYDLWAINAASGVAQRVRQFGLQQSGEPFFFASLGSKVVFVAGEGAQRLIWATDGTPAGTLPVSSRTVEQGLYGEYESPRVPVAVDRGVVLPVGTEQAIRGLWSSDGTLGGTIQTVAMPNLEGIGDLISWRGVSYFTRKQGDQLGVWRSDGTPAGTTLIKSFSFSSQIVLFLTKTEQNLYFIAGTPATSIGTSGDIKLWKSDGTAIGTQVAATLPSFFGYSGVGSGLPQNVEVVGNRLFFTASTEANGYELWVSDGTQAGTRLVKDVSGGSSDSFLRGLTAVGERLFLLSGLRPSDGLDLWVSDGSEAGTQLVKEFGPLIPSLPPNVNGQTTGVGDVAFITGWDSSTWLELWRSDGTPANTRLVKDINQQPGPGLTAASIPHDLVAFQGKLLFAANDGIHGDELWISDGSAAGTQLIADINPGYYRSEISGITVFDKVAVFAASNGPNGIELWRTDGTTAGTTQLADVAPGPSSSNPAGFVMSGKKLFFLADDGTTGRELHMLPFVSAYRIALPHIGR